MDDCQTYQRGIMPHRFLHIARHYWLSAFGQLLYNALTKSPLLGLSSPAILPNACQRSVTVSSEINVKNALNSIELATIGHAIAEVGKIARIACSQKVIEVDIELGLPLGDHANLWREQIKSALMAVADGAAVEVTITARIASHAVQTSLKPVAGIKNIIAIASGKGGVGKSTVASNVALALQAAGAVVGVLDADIYGPSQPHLLDVVGQRPVSDDGKTMQPLIGHGLKVMSIGFLVDPDQPMVWRGPMVTSALNQLMYQTVWGELDYLIVDMPPGTGDIQLTLSQKIPVSGAVIVTTPQNIATLDARKGLAMFRKVSIPILGVVENMSTHICSNCNHEEAIFGSGGAANIVKDFDVPLLGQMPLTTMIREHADSGTPTVIAAPDSAEAKAYMNAALCIAAAQATMRADYSSKFGNISIEEGS